MSKITTLQPLDPLRVFLEFDPEYQVYVAQCLQTGHLVTADDPELAKEMIAELLEDEVSIAVTANDLSTLLSSPAPMELFFKFDLALRAGAIEDGRTIRVSGVVPQQLRMIVGQDYNSVEVRTEIRIATGRTKAA